MKKRVSAAMLLAMGIMCSLVQCAAPKTDVPSENEAKKEETRMTTENITAASDAVQGSTDELTEALDKAKKYIDTLTINNSINDPEAVVSTWGRFFTWDNEKRENGKPYLYEWSYYNGVVFEGLSDVYDVTGDKVYADYVMKYLNGMIESDGSWTQLEQGQAAGYNKNHGLDCYKTASILLDYYDMTGDDRYLKKADELYQDLQDAKADYMDESIGGNYYHTWISTPEYAVWLDGIYMAQPFMAQYAARYDKTELKNIAARFVWVGENMYNKENGLYYHAAGADKNSGSYWLRSVGWYIAAMADVMEYMDSDDLNAMKEQMKKLVDGMIPYQDEETGMWSNYVTGAADHANNRLETSGTSLMVYGIMKAVNHGWMDSSYTDVAIRAFEGMCKNKIKGDDLTDICFIGAPGSANATFYDNEGKGSGPFIMAYAEMLRYKKTQK